MTYTTRGGQNVLSLKIFAYIFGRKNVTGILELFYHPQSLRCWPQLPVTFHVNLIHRSEDIAIWIFRIFGLKCLFRVKVKVWTLAIAPLAWVRLVTSSALQSRKWQLIGMSQWCRSALCGHPLLAITDNWTHGAASRHTIAPSATIGLHPIAIATTHFPSRWG